MVSIVVADPDLGRCPNCERVEKELALLKTQLTAKDQRVHTLEEQVTELQGYVFGRHHKSPNPPKTPGAKAKHIGWFRPKPTAIDRTEAVSLDVCPNCGSKNLSLCAEIEEHTQEDIVLPEPQVTLYRKQVYWCRGCGKKVRGKGKNELPGSPIGPVTKSVADFFRYKVKVTQRDIVRIFKGLFHLSVTEGAIQGFHTQTRKKAAPLHEQLKDQIKTEPAVHADETGAPINGENGWTWLAASRRIALYTTGESRGGKVIQAILGENFEGILASDFYAGYNKSIRAKAKQKCLVHLDRDLKKLLMNFPIHDPVFIWAKRVRNFFQEARALYDAYHAGKLTAEQLACASGRFKNELLTLIQLKACEPDIRRLSKRLLNHSHELLVFLDYPDLVSPDNNYAERLIRACAIFRKITGGFRSQAGTLNHDVLMSLAQTAHLNGKDPLTLFRHILTATSTTVSLDYCLSP